MSTRRYLHFLGSVTQRVWAYEQAKLDLDEHLRTLDEATDYEQALKDVRGKLIKLLEREMAVAPPRAPPIQRQVDLLRAQLALLAAERRVLSQENQHLRSVVGDVGELREAVERRNVDLHQRVGHVEAKVTAHERASLIEEIEERLAVLEKDYQILRRDGALDQAALLDVRQRINRHKRLLERIKQA